VLVFDLNTCHIHLNDGSKFELFFSTLIRKKIHVLPPVSIFYANDLLLDYFFFLLVVCTTTLGDSTVRSEDTLHCQAVFFCLLRYTATSGGRNRRKSHVSYSSQKPNISRGNFSRQRQKKVI